MKHAHTKSSLMSISDTYQTQFVQEHTQYMSNRDWHVSLTMNAKYQCLQNVHAQLKVNA